MVGPVETHRLPAAVSGGGEHLGVRQVSATNLAGRRRSTADWTTAYAGTGTAVMGPGARRLDGTVAVIRSKAVQVGDYRQENAIVHTISPGIAATVLLEKPRRR